MQKLPLRVLSSLSSFVCLQRRKFLSGGAAAATPDSGANGSPIPSPAKGANGATLRANGIPPLQLPNGTAPAASHVPDSQAAAGTAPRSEGAAGAAGAASAAPNSRAISSSLSSATPRRPSTERRADGRDVRPLLGGTLGIRGKTPRSPGGLKRPGAPRLPGGAASMPGRTSRPYPPVVALGTEAGSPAAARWLDDAPPHMRARHRQLLMSWLAACAEAEPPPPPPPAEAAGPTGASAQGVDSGTGLGSGSGSGCWSEADAAAGAGSVEPRVTARRQRLLQSWPLERVAVARTSSESLEAPALASPPPESGGASVRP